VSFNPAIKEIKAESKQFIDANVWDGDDRSGAASDSVLFTPDDLQELINDLIERLVEGSYI